MAYHVLSSRSRRIRIPVFNVTGTEYVLQAAPIPDGLNYAAIYQFIHRMFEGRLNEI